MATRRNYSAKISPNGDLILRSRDIYAKQVFFSWGSDQNRIDASYYGRGLNDDVGDHETWEWKLTPEAAEHMVMLFKKHGSDPDYYSGIDKRRAKELDAILQDYLDEVSDAGDRP